MSDRVLASGVTPGRTVVGDDAPVGGPPRILELRAVSGGYVRGFDVVHDVAMGVAPGEVVLVIGPNGAGKSTVLQACLNRLPVRAGTILLEGRDCGSLAAHQLVRRGVGYLPQGHSVFPGLSVADNVLMGVRCRTRSRRQARSALDQIRQDVPALRRFWHRRAGDLSGGQQRLVELARLRATRPVVALVDEPSTGVAPALCGELYDELAQLAAQGAGILLVDQDIERALPIADTVVVMEQGRVTLTGPRHEFAGRVRQVVASWIASPSAAGKAPRSGPGGSRAGTLGGGLPSAGAVGTGPSRA